MLGFDLTLLCNTSFQYCRLGRGTKPNIRKTVSIQPTIVLTCGIGKNSLFIGYGSVNLPHVGILDIHNDESQVIIQGGFRAFPRPVGKILN